MTYMTARFYTGSSSRSVNEIDDIVGGELVPELEKLGLVRFTTVQLSDGRIGSISFFDDMKQAQDGQKIATDWVASTGVMAGYSLNQSLSGEVIFTTGSGEEPTSYNDLPGIIRLYQTDASRAEILTGFRNETAKVVEGVAGLIRLNAVHLDDGRVATLSLCHTQADLQKIAERAREMRGNADSILAKCLPNDPDTIEARLINSRKA